MPTPSPARQTPPSPPKAGAAPPESSADAADPARHRPAVLPTANDPDKASQREEAALDNVRRGYDDATGRAAGLSGQADGDTQGGPGANNDAANPPPSPRPGTAKD